MKEIKHVIKDPLGIHARPAGRMVKVASKFECDIRIGTPLKMVNAKRIIGVMTLALKQGSEATLHFSGADEEEAAAAIGKFLEDSF